MGTGDDRVEFGIALQRVDGPGEQARAFEALGYDYVSCGEHVCFNVPSSNSFVSLSVAAGATTRIRLINSIALVPLYPPALLAKLGAALDVASNGRFSFGVGIGGEIAREFEACGVPVHERGARTNEALEIITRLWSEPSVDFEGRFVSFRGASIEPKPVQQPRPPIWISGRKDGAMRRTARFGDGWLPYMYTPDMLSSSLATIRAEAGDPVGYLQADARVLPFADASFDTAFSAYGAVPFVADPERVMAEVARVLRPGGTWAFSVTHPIRWAFPDDPGEHGLTATRSYFDRTPYVEAADDGEVVYAEHHRTLGDRVRDVVGAGLALVDLVEPEWPEGHDRVWGGWSPLRGRRLPGTAILVTRRT